jgi:hypothetical protein
MSEGLINAAKFALAGITVGVGTAFLTDQVANLVLAPLLQPGPGMSSAGVTGRLAFQIVGCSALVGVGLYCGDRVMDALGEGDPLFRAVYYQTAFAAMGTARNAASGMSGLLNRASSGLSSAPPVSSSGGVAQATPVNTASSCGSAGCGN